MVFGDGGLDVHALAPSVQEARPELSSVKRGPGWTVRVPSLRRHDPDQVRRVAASAASQPLKRDTPENARETTLQRRRVKAGGQLDVRARSSSVGAWPSSRSPARASTSAARCARPGRVSRPALACRCWSAPIAAGAWLPVLDRLIGCCRSSPGCGRSADDAVGDRSIFTAAIKLIAYFSCARIGARRCRWTRRRPACARRSTDRWLPRSGALASGVMAWSPLRRALMRMAFRQRTHSRCAYLAR